MEQNTTDSTKKEKIEKHHKTLIDKILSRSRLFFYGGALVGLLSCGNSLVKLMSVTKEYRDMPIVREYNQTEQLLSSLHRARYEASHVVEYALPEKIQKSLDEISIKRETVTSLDNIIKQVEQKLAEMKNIEIVGDYKKRVEHITRHGVTGGLTGIALMLFSLPFIYSDKRNRKRDAEIGALTPNVKLYK